MAAPTDARASRTARSVLARNMLWNFLGQAVPLVIALATIPGLIDGYGTDRFGLLALVWVCIGYFGLFDLGLSRALTQLVSAAGEDTAPDVLGASIWTGLVTIGLIGVVGGTLLGALTPWLVEDVLTMPDTLHAEARASFLLVAVSVPLLTLGLGLRGILEGRHRFGIVNAVRVPLGSISFLGPFLLLAVSDSLIPAVLVLIAARAASGLLYLRFCLEAAPEMRGGIRLSRRVVKPLLRFGGWMTVSNVIGPLMVHFDRFLIGALISVTATAYYSVPYDMVTRLWIIPAAMAGVLFPAFATGWVRDPRTATDLMVRASKYTFAALFAPVLILVAFAHEILDFWLGAEFAAESALVLQILALGVLTNCVAHIPFAFVQGLGRADVTAKLHLAEAPLYLVLLWLAVSGFGIAGAAAAWALRTTADMVLLFVAAGRFAGRPLVQPAHGLAAIGGACLAAVLLAQVPDAATRLLLVAPVLVAFLVATWFLLLSSGERALALRWPTEH